jgi:CHAT domain-containing protein
VTLSASGERRAEDVSGEGVLGIQGAFLIGGARTVLVDQWPTQDAATADLMINLYERLWSVEGQEVGPAVWLRSAQLKMIEKRLPPADWAAFVCIGDWQ